ncbi:MAG: ABC transporter ATP-binding protein [Desulfuromonadales bacterium]|nr:ABC transporter ATP-binding protein [Desulfuromonadales bacterium]MBN2791191.1 ABC transporter ATP-binding protein [Desulfuromonadales bacterium]
MAGLLKIDQLTKIFNRHRPDETTALSDLSLTILQEECIALTGPSGSGKTTLLSLLGCMSRPTSGNILFQGRNISRLPERFLAQIRRDSFGFIFQQYNLLRSHTVLENLMLPLYPTDRQWKEIRRRALELLERFQLGNMHSKKITQLSGGEQQRVAIARALMADPEVIIADEPTAHLDEQLSAELLDILATLNGEGKTIIIATHDPFIYAADIIQRRISLQHGHITADTMP